MKGLKFIEDPNVPPNVVAFVGPDTARVFVPADHPEGWIIGIGWKIYHEPKGHAVTYEVPRFHGIITDLADPSLEGR